MSADRHLTDFSGLKLIGNSSFWKADRELTDIVRLVEIVSSSSRGLTAR